MKVYILTLIPLVILFVVLSFDEAQIAFALLTFGFGVIVTFVVVNALALMVLAFPAIMASRVAGNVAGWAVFGVLVIALVFGPGTVRRHLTAGLNDAASDVSSVLAALPQTIELTYPEGYVAHGWSDAQLVVERNATSRKEVEVLCDALCLALLSLETVNWVQIARPNWETYRLRIDPGTSRVVVDDLSDDSGPEVSIFLEDRLFPENKTSALQIWSGLQHRATRKVVDHREDDRVVSARNYYSYTGVDDLVIFFPTLSTSLGSGIEAPWDWPSRRFASDPDGLPDLASDLAAIGLPLREGNKAELAPNTNLSLLKMQVDALLSQPIPFGSRRVEPFPEVDRKLIASFVGLLGEARLDPNLFDTLLTLFNDPRNYDKRPIINLISGTDQAAPFVASVLMTNQTSNVDTQYFDLLKNLTDTQNRAVWRILDADIGLARLFDGATNRQREIYMRNLNHMEGLEIRLLERAMALAMDSQPTASSQDAPIGTTDVIRSALNSSTKLPVELHSQIIPLIIEWLERNIDIAQTVRPNCHFLVTAAIKALDEIGGKPEADAFLQRYSVSCPKR